MEALVATICIAALALLSGFSLVDLGVQGFALDQFSFPIVGTLVIAVSACALFVLMAYNTVAYARNGDLRQKAWKQLTQKSGNDALPDDFRVHLLVPRSKKERQLFFFVSLTAGICEEFLLRGVLFATVMSLFPALPLYAMLVICALLFGVAHAYQGVKGIAQTSAVGLFLGLLYLATGSLIPGMILHFVMDLSSCFIAPDAPVNQQMPSARGVQ
jgi:membrane protease YdiL (CAAX protease family)